MAKIYRSKLQIVQKRRSEAFLKRQRDVTALSALLKEEITHLDSMVRAERRCLTMVLSSERSRRLRDFTECRRLSSETWFDKASRKKGITGENLLILLESRLDNVVFRLGFASSRKEARQLVTHNHFTVNGKKVNIPSYEVKAGDVIKVKEKSTNSPKFKEVKEMSITVPSWLTVDG